MGLKLYTVYIHNGLDYEDEDWDTELIVACNEEEAEGKGAVLLNENYGPNYIDRYFFVTEISSVDGHPIIIGEHE